MPTLSDNDTDSAIDKHYNHGQGSYGDEPTGSHDTLDDFSDTENDEFKKLTDNWDTDMGGKGNNPPAGSLAAKNPKLQKALKFAKKRGGIIGLIGIFGVGGGILAGFFGPASLLISMTENFSLSNDSSSTALERRFMKVFGNITDESNDPVCVNSSKSIKCKMGRISNKALKQLSKKNVIAVIDGVDYDGKTTKGYPKKNPSHYKIDLDDGYGQRSIAAKDMPGFLAKNPKAASKILGIKGAFNLRVKAWAGKHITNKFFKKFNISKKGGLLEGAKTKFNSAAEKLEDILKRLAKKIPGADKIGGVADAIKGKVDAHLGKAKLGGTGYVIAVAGCIGVKAPGYIAAGVAGVQLLQVMPYFMETVGSPGSKQKAAGVDSTASDLGSDEVEAAGLLLTNKTKDSDGNMTSAMDSQYLQAGLGVNKNKPPVSQDYTPGYSILTNPAIIASKKVADATEGACNVILSPAAMWAAFAVDSAITVAASTTVIGGLVKVGASWVIGEVVSKVTSDLVGDTARNLLVDLAKNDKIGKAQGKALGDVIGISAASFFSAGGMARNLPVLKKSQLVAFNDMQKQNEDQQRSMDLATLSPFDVSSRYTFLGSIVNNARLGLLSNGGYSLSSALSTMASLPSVLSTNTGAATNFTENYCGYAKDFGLNTDNDGDSPAINMAGLPCTGITPSQASMSTSEAIDLMISEGWLDESKDIPDGATIDDLVSSGYIKADTPLAEYISSCSDASSGDYLFNAAGCTIADNTKDPSAASSKNGCSPAEIEKDGKTESTTNCTNNLDIGEDSKTAESVKDNRSMQAMAVFLLDFQAAQSINGEDDIEPSGGTSSTAGATIDMENLYNDSTSVACAPGTNEVRNDTGYRKGNPVPVKLCALPDTNDSGKGPALVNSRASGAALAMFSQMKQDLNITGTLQFNDSFRTMAEQEQAKADYGDQAATPGFSNHQMGIAFDVNGNGQGSCAYSMGVTSCANSAVWNWLNTHAANYGFKQFSQEWWHWSADGN